jgi:hypothetical protein
MPAVLHLDTTLAWMTPVLEHYLAFQWAVRLHL